MHRFIFIALLALLMAVPAQAGTKYDLAYYFGMVTTDGGSTLTDGQWYLNAERGAYNDLTEGPYFDDPENAQLIHSEGGYVMMSGWWYSDSQSRWVRNGTRIFVVGDDYIDYCGVVLWHEGVSVIADKRFRFSRYAEVGDMEVLENTATVSPGGQQIKSAFGIFLQADGITLPASVVPVSGDVPNCLRVMINDKSSMSANQMIQVLAPGRGTTLSRQMNYYETGGPIGQMDCYVTTKVSAWGDETSFDTSLGPFTDPPEIMEIQAGVLALTIPAEFVREQSGTTVVVPMF